ncbi:DinB family protein [Kitasatospora sp. NPDC049285]|uniref:DinB family protein n=1 Tax=Kitasatospora sp. NPDC049285 TaxID=3157096 RepID=UPI003417791A
MFDPAPLRQAYRDLLTGAEEIADAPPAPLPPGEWTAEQVLAHVALVTSGTLAAVATVAAGAPAGYDNRAALDTWTIDRVIARTGGGAALRERVRAQGEALCTLAAALDRAELDTPVPALLLSGGRLMFEGQLPVGDLVGGLAAVELPAHTAQLLATAAR